MDMENPAAEMPGACGHPGQPAPSFVGGDGLDLLKKHLVRIAAPNGLPPKDPDSIKRFFHSRPSGARIVLGRRELKAGRS
jgi:hypothetical protein